MSSFRVLTPILLCLLLGCPGGGEAGKEGHGRHGGRGGPRAQAPVSIACEPALLERVEEVLIGHAALEAEASVDLTARVAGRVAELKVEAGDVVEAGQLLARLDDTRASLRIREATLALAQAKTELERAQNLGQQGLSTVEEQDQAKQAVQQAELQLESARLDVADLSLLSPITGVVTAREIDLGDHLEPGTLAFQIADRTPLLARVRIPEAQAESVVEGQDARVLVDGMDTELVGEVARVAPVVDLESGTVIVTVALHQGIEGVRINRFATIRVVTAVREQAVTIPHAALALRGEDDRVLVFEPKGERAGVVRLQTIATGVRQGDRIEVLEGLTAGAQVVVAAPDDLRDGTQVRLAGSGPPRVEREGAAPVDSRSHE
jgi:membrane fusion protein (multidrug efflux system)